MSVTTGAGATGFPVNGVVEIMIRNQQAAHVTKQVNMALMKQAFALFQQRSVNLGDITVDDSNLGDILVILVDIVHQRPLPAAITVETMISLANLAISGDGRLHQDFFTMTQDYFLQFIKPEAPGSYICDSASFLQYLYAADKLTIDKTMFPPPDIWRDLLSNVTIDAGGRIITRRGVVMFRDGVSMSLYNRICAAHQYIIFHIIDQGRRYMLRQQANRVSVIAAHVNLSGVLGRGFLDLHTNPNPIDTDLHRESIADFVKKLEDGAADQPDAKGAIFRHLKDVVIPRLMMMDGNGPGWHANIPGGI